MSCLHVKTFCCVLSLKTGTLLIMYINLLYAFFGFIAWTSTGAIIFMYSKHDDVSDRRTTVTIAMHVSIGFVLTAIEISMSYFLYLALRKEEPRYLRRFMFWSVVSIALNVLSSTLSAIFLQRYTFLQVFPNAIGSVLQVYCLVVIRSACHEMVAEAEQARRHRLQYAPSVRSGADKESNM